MINNISSYYKPILRKYLNKPMLTGDERTEALKIIEIIQITALVESVQRRKYEIKYDLYPDRNHEIWHRHLIDFYSDYYYINEQNIISQYNEIHELIIFFYSYFFTIISVDLRLNNEIADDNENESDHLSDQGKPYSTNKDWHREDYIDYDNRYNEDSFNVNENESEHLNDWVNSNSDGEDWGREDYNDYDNQCNEDSFNDNNCDNFKTYYESQEKLLLKVLSYLKILVFLFIVHICISLVK